MKRILIVNTHYKTGGIKKSLDNLVKYLSKNNKVDLFFLNYPLMFGDSLKNKNVRVLKPLKPIDAYYSTFSEIRQKNKIVQYLFFKLFFKIKRLFFGSEKTIKKILSKSNIILDTYDIAISYSHDVWTNGFSGGCNYFVLNKVKAIKKYAWIHGEMSNIGLDNKRALMTYTGFDKVINVSKACNKDFHELVKGAIPCDYIYNLFDADDILKKSKEFVEKSYFGDFTFVSVGRIHPVKRIDKVNYISKRLLDLGISFKWIVIGDGPLLENLKRQAIDMGLDGVVEYLGNQTNPYKFISKSDLFVHLSDSESFSLVINEALILNTPVITTNFPSSSETILEGYNGFIFDKTVDGAFDKVLYCVYHKDELTAIKQRLEKKPWLNTLKKQSEDKIQALINN